MNQEYDFTVAIFGYGGRGMIYADNFVRLGVRITAVCDLSKDRRLLAEQRYGCRTYGDETEFFAAGKVADVLVVATLDDQHFEPTVRALHAGYDVILEKPIALKKEEWDGIAAVADETKRSVSVCHVLRYAPFYQKIKRLLDSGDFGEIIHISMTENVGYYHFAHSYVRGPWRNTETSAPVILAKSCHDLDIITWFIGRKCTAVSSFGSLSYFNRAHAPEGAAKRCADCIYRESCEYSCFKIYLNDEYEKLAALARHGRLGSTKEEIIATLEDEKNPYGRCVFQCDNNVYDHQTVNMQFEDGVTAQFTLSAFTQRMFRSVHIYCQKGEIYGEGDQVRYMFFGDDCEKVEPIEFENEVYASHGGGDIGLVEAFANTYGKGKMLSDIHVSLQSHDMGYAADLSAKEGGKVIEVYKGC